MPSRVANMVERWREQRRLRKIGRMISVDRREAWRLAEEEADRRRRHENETRAREKRQADTAWDHALPGGKDYKGPFNV